MLQIKLKASKQECYTTTKYEVLLQIYFSAYSHSYNLINKYERNGILRFSVHVERSHSLLHMLMLNVCAARSCCAARAKCITELHLLRVVRLRVLLSKIDAKFKM